MVDRISLSTSLNKSKGNKLTFFKVILLLTICLFLTSNQGFSQDSKQHFTLHKLDSSVTINAYEIALNDFGKLDQYRFLDKRRTILFVDNKVSVELYSANELKSLYQKRISPFTIINDSNFIHVKFELGTDNAIHETFIKQ